MNNQDIPTIPTDKLYEIFNDELNYFSIYAKAASIQANKNTIYPESFFIAFIYIGFNPIQIALSNSQCNLQILLNQLKSNLNTNTNPSENPNHINIHQDVWNALQIAAIIAYNSNTNKQDKIQPQHLAIAFINSSPSIQLALKNSNTNTEKLIQELQSIT